MIKSKQLEAWFFSIATYSQINYFRAINFIIFLQPLSITLLKLRWVLSAVLSLSLPTVEMQPFLSTLNRKLNVIFNELIHFILNFFADPAQSTNRMYTLLSVQLWSFPQEKMSCEEAAASGTCQFRCCVELFQEE